MCLTRWLLHYLIVHVGTMEAAMYSSKLFLSYNEPIIYS